MPPAVVDYNKRLFAFVACAGHGLKLSTSNRLRFGAHFVATVFHKLREQIPLLTRG